MKELKIKGFLSFNIGIRDNQNVFYDNDFNGDFSVVIVNKDDIKAISYWINQNSDDDSKLVLIVMKDGVKYFCDDKLSDLY